MPDYGSAEYWDERYALDPKAQFDWLQTYDALKHIVTKFIVPESEILVVGCGNSRLSSDLYDDGYKFVTSIDISPVVIKQMAARHAEQEDMEFTTMDVCKLEYPSECFNFVIDKGTFDTILCGEDSFRNTVLATKEIYRVLKPGGTFVMVSYGMPVARLGYLQSRTLDWNVEYTSLGKPDIDTVDSPDAPPGSSPVHYVYVCTKPSVTRR